jgi:murein DD-endopeptidase MepM/ murein hydrolase activator NlpD
MQQFRRHVGRAVPHITSPAVLLALSAALAACGGGGLRERFRPASPRDAYVEGLRAAGLDRTALGRDWAAAADRAAARPAEAAAPLREQGAFAAGEATAVAWRVRPRRGQRLTVELDAQADSGTRLFHDLWLEPGGDTSRTRLVQSGDGLTARYELDADGADDRYVLRLQPELLRAVRWSVRFEAGPSLAFPVQGRDSRAAQSFWGADRDGGARSHQGVDIFAPRGTPVLAASDGVVRWVGENRLGGNVVFLADPARGHSLYYAHLDRQAVATGQSVRTGDTLGFVGNTGNARTTRPHLHFGVYRAGEGRGRPVSPYVDTRRRRPRGRRARRRARRAARAGGRRARRAAGRPRARGGVGRRAARATLGTVDAAARRRAALRLPDGRAGYVAAAALEAADRPVARERGRRRPPGARPPAADAPALAEGDGREGACTAASARTGSSRSPAGRAGGSSPGAGRRLTRGSARRRGPAGGGPGSATLRNHHRARPHA